LTPIRLVVTLPAPAHDPELRMKASEISLFSAKEQELLVSSEPKRLVELDEDELGDLLTRVRRARGKYVDLHRRQSVATIKAAGKRSAAGQSNERTARKAEIFEDAVSRVARYLSKAARANASALKDERLSAAGAVSSSATSGAKRAPAKRRKPASATSSKKAKPIVEPARKGATSASNKRNQASSDQRKRGKK
jgi:hypothetical protein